MRPSSLQPYSDATREQIAALRLQVATREDELHALKKELHALQTRYLAEIGPLYDELIPLDEAVAEAEIKAGLRLPPEEEADDDGGEGDAEADAVEAAACSNAAEPSADLKRMFRDLAKRLHPDVTSHHSADERTRYRRHSLMAEANRAYAERDEDRLRLILRAWQLDPDAVVDDDADVAAARMERRAAALRARLVEIDVEFADLHRSAIARLKARSDDARAKGWDLFAEMMRQTRREIATARAKLVRLRGSA